MKKRTDIKQHIWWHGRLLLVFGGVWLAAAFVIQMVSSVYAESYEFEETSVRLISYDKTAPADGKTPIRFTVEFFGYKCTDPDYRGVYIIYPRAEYCNDATGTDYGPSTGTVVRTNAYPAYSGNATTTGTINSNGFSGNMTGGTSIGHPHHQVISPGPDGRVILSLTSTVGESKHIKVDNSNISDPNRIEFDVTFTQVPGRKSVPADPNAPPPSSAQGSTPKFIPVGDPIETAETEKIFKPATVRVNDTPISKSDDKQEIQQNKDIVLSGVAAPNAQITLYIFSEPQVAKLVADASGNWTHIIKGGLPVGDHHVETEVLDPATNTKTKRINLTSFKIVGTLKTDGVSKGDTTGTAKQSSLSPLWITGIAAIVALVICIVLARYHVFAHIFKKKYKKQLTRSSHRK